MTDFIPAAYSDDTGADPALEARVNAQRQLLVGLLAFVARTPDGMAFLSGLLDEQQVPSDQEEDPGIVPDKAFALQNATDHDVSAMLESAIARARATESRGS